LIICFHQFGPRGAVACGLLLLGLVLGGCAASPLGEAGAGPSTTVKPATASRLGDTATVPLQDLNLTRSEIPVLLQQARLQPYAPPLEPVSCASLQLALAALDEVLPPDVDTSSPKPGEQGWAEQGGEMVGDAVWDALRNTAEGVIPLRGWVRKLSGAERHSAAVQSALRAGEARRSFLIGHAQARGCSPRPVLTRPGVP
jgi:hypothetical protein